MGKLSVQIWLGQPFRNIMTKQEINKIEELEKYYSYYIDDCPFCGPKSSPKLYIFGQDLGMYTATIECNLCLCSQEEMYGELEEELVKKVLKRWNTRLMVNLMGVCHEKY